MMECKVSCFLRKRIKISLFELGVNVLVFDIRSVYLIIQNFIFQPFPGCNRDAIGEVQNFASVTKYFQQFKESDFFNAVADFQLLIALAKLDAYPLLSYLEELIDGLRDQNKSSVDKWAQKEHWQTVSQLMQAQGHVGNGMPPNGGPDILDFPSDQMNFWDCKHCTFHNNEPNTSCEMCGLPRN